MYSRRDCDMGETDSDNDGGGKEMKEALLKKEDIEEGGWLEGEGEGEGEGDGDSAAEESAPRSPPVPSLREFLKLGRPEFPILLLATLLMITNQVMQLVNPKLLGHAYDALVDPKLDAASKTSRINHTMTLVLCLHSTGVLAGFGRGALMGTAGERIVARLRTSLYSQILRQEIAFFDSHKSGDLVSRLGSDTTVVRQAISNSWVEVSIGLARLVASICLMFSISPRLASVTLGGCLFVYAVCVPFGRAIGRLSRAYQEVLGEAQGYPTEVIGAMRTVKAFAAEGREVERYRAKIGHPGGGGACWPDSDPQTTYSLGFWRSLLSSGFYNFVFGAGFGAMYLSLWYGFTLVDDGRMTLGELTAFQAYIFLIGGSLAHTSRSISQLIEAKGASARIFELLRREPAITSPPHPQADPSNPTNSPTRGPAPPPHTAFQLLHQEPTTTPPQTMPTTDPPHVAIQFQNVSFAYPTRPNNPVLKHFTLSFPPNSTTALVGCSGAGKTTVVSLLQRFYDVTDGSILIDNVDIRNLDLTQMHSKIGYVQQEPQLFGSTIRENVAYGMNRPVSDDEIHDACRRVNAYEFISRWPEGLGTMVGERGVTLSGGQKQRLAIARAILMDPKILLLDEATSALDAESEHLVQRAVDAASKGRTVVMIAHRLSTIKNADNIVVLEGGYIVGVGSHDELLGRCETYRSLIKRQWRVGRILDH